MLYAIVVVLVLILDQVVKYWTNTTLAIGAVKDFIPGFMQLTHHRNTGAAFGLLGDQPWARWVFVGLTVVFCAVIVVILSKNIIKGKPGRWLIVLITAGGIGNCIDRIFNGYVVDMFDFTFKIFGYDFPIFNVADIFLTVCGFIFCIWLIFSKTEEEPEDKKSRPARRAVPERREAPAPQEDYITQLKKPVATAKVELEEQREKARKEAEMQARLNRPRSNTESQPAESNDPFAEFFTSAPQPEAPAPSRPVEPQFTPEPRPVAPAPRLVPEPTAAPAAPKSDTEFSLEDILAEFSD